MIFSPFFLRVMQRARFVLKKKKKTWLNKLARLLDISTRGYVSYKNSHIAEGGDFIKTVVNKRTALMCLSSTE